MCSVACDVRQNAQLDLRVVGVHERLALARHKVAAQAAAQLGADGNVLQVRLGGGDAPGARSVWMKVEWTRPSAASAFSRPST